MGPRPEHLRASALTRASRVGRVECGIVEARSSMLGSRIFDAGSEDLLAPRIRGPILDQRVLDPRSEHRGSSLVVVVVLLVVVVVVVVVVVAPAPPRRRRRRRCRSSSSSSPSSSSLLLVVVVVVGGGQPRASSHGAPRAESLEPGTWSLESHGAPRASRATTATATTATATTTTTATATTAELRARRGPSLGPRARAGLSRPRSSCRVDRE